MEKREIKYKKLGSFLKKIYSCKVALECDHHSKRNLLEFLMNHFIKFCCDTSFIFRKLFRGLYFTGSYFEGLRVKEATEFDVDVIFSFQNCLKYKVTELESPLSFATLYITEIDSISEPENLELQSFFDAEKFLSSKNVLKWFQSLIDSFIAHSNLSYPDLKKIKTTHSGPARTVRVHYKSVWISIDLVPVVLISADKLEKFALNHVPNFSEESLSLSILVPKPFKSKMYGEFCAETLDRAWRIHFPETEKNIIQGMEQLKQLIMLMKDLDGNDCSLHMFQYLRDIENWPICSYFIKVVAFWLVKKHPHFNYWKTSKMGLLFIQFLEAMEQHLKSNFLSHILYPEFNLFHSLSQRTMFDLQRRIRNIITMVEDNPRNLLRLYNTPVLLPRKL